MPAAPKKSTKKRSHPPLYNIWWGAYRRCHDPRRKDYPHYGARGIKMCRKWRGGTEANDYSIDGYYEFVKWANSHGYVKGKTLDRINSRHGYRPENCRWVWSKSQSYNRSTNHYITIDGTTHTLKAWSEIVGIGSDTILHRIERGMTEQEAVMTPLKRKVKKKEE